MRAFRPTPRSSTLRLVLAIVLPLVVLVPLAGLASIAFGVSRPSYTLDGVTLVVKSGDLFAGDRTVRLADITEARAVTLRGGHRTAGTALPGFCAGRFSYPDLGEVWQVTTCSPSAVLVRSTGHSQPLILTPPDPEAFLTRLRSSGEATIDLPPVDKGPLKIIAFIVVPLAVLSLGSMSLLLLLGPSRMRYVVTDGALEVHTLFSRSRWPTAGARARAHVPTRLLRVMGTGAPGYYTGRFRESGQSCRVYATDLTTMLLFEGEARVLLSPEDREGMLLALEEQGVTIEGHEGGIDEHGPPIEQSEG